MKASDIFKSKYLKAEDLRGRDISLTIDRVEMASMPSGPPKPAVFFEGKDKGLILNKTNFNAIAQVTGEDETDDWAGHKITIFATETEFGGEMVDCIRVRRKKAAAGSNGQERPPVRETEPADLPDDDEVPF